MNCPGSMTLADLVLHHLLPRSAAGGGARVLGIAGFPFTGKTHLARAVEATWQTGAVTLLPTESVVVPRRSRRLRGIDGCSPEGHDMQRLMASVTSLRSGQSVMSQDYSWESGDARRSKLLHGVSADGLLIIDGTVAAASPIFEQCDLVIFLSPVRKAKWLPLACRRDTSERQWEPTAAKLQNLHKSATSAMLMDSIARHSLCISIRVDPTSWTWFLPGCGLCEHPPGDAIAQAPISIAGCKAR